MNDINRYFNRSVEPLIFKTLKRGYIAVLIGPRQTGKTTLAQKVASSQKIPSFYYTLDDVMLRNRIAKDFSYIQNDLELRLGKELHTLKNSILLIIDEAQKEPLVFDLVKLLHDKYKKTVHILLTGSSSLEIQKNTAESLAGRALYTYLYPLSIGEMIRTTYCLPSNSDSLFDFTHMNIRALKEKQSLLYHKQEKLDQLLPQLLIYGLLPGTWQKPIHERGDYFKSIVSLYLEKDIRLMGLVNDLERYQQFLELIGYELGQLLNLSHVSSQTQISTNTLRSYRSLLAHTFIINLLPPYIHIPQKRMVKNHKVYFYDVGLANFLAGRSRIENIYDSRVGGAIFENILLKSFEYFARSQTYSPKTYFYRDYHNHEIDLIIQSGDKIIPVEITLSKSPVRKKIKNLQLFLQEEKRAECGIIINTGLVSEIQKSPKPIYSLPWWLWW